MSNKINKTVWFVSIKIIKDAFIIYYNHNLQPLLDN